MHQTWREGTSPFRRGIARSLTLWKALASPLLRQLQLSRPYRDGITQLACILPSSCLPPPFPLSCCKSLRRMHLNSRPNISLRDRPCTNWWRVSCSVVCVCNVCGKIRVCALGCMRVHVRMRGAASVACLRAYIELCMLVHMPRDMRVCVRACEDACVRKKIYERMPLTCMEAIWVRMSSTLAPISLRVASSSLVSIILSISTVCSPHMATTFAQE